MSPSSDKFYVYMAWHPVSGDPVYVGKGCGNRLSAHNYLVRKKRHYNPTITAHVELYGPLEFFIVREGLSDPEAIATEIALISRFGRADTGAGPLYNRTDGGDGWSGPKSPEHRAKISASHKGRIRSAEHSAKISASKKGKKVPKLSAVASARFKGIPKTAEHNAKNSAAQKGRPKTAEHRANISANKIAFYAAKRALETQKAAP